MKPILLFLGSLVLLVLVFLSGVIITANVIAEPEPHKFANINTPDLWTSKPKAVDAVNQDYQRLPSATPPASLAAETRETPAVQQTAAGEAVDNTVTASVNPQQPASVPQPQGERKAMVDPAQADWCFARYRSYRIEDNSYQPLSGGPRRQCQAPGAAATETVAAAPMRDEPQAPQIQDELQPLPESPAARVDQRADEGTAGYAQSQAVNTGAPAGSHEEWCFARYRSYQAEDNSYQPFAGGPRRQCQSPFG
ncbi:BA14K family protein [Neorhizobium galegae]|uniref:BA14K family protein n=1 Tax=Neorhizobium galegae TaxID=399 RepID=UPI00062115B6|nr:BA14K family protein [Neorhizobium galegae]CDZ27427.1 BA14K-like protein [Neorhizobium galegae bv. officinalis]MCM2497488.1 BA14K family protein [Neorhizobium galegae]MCQ1771578.1 BA14K family protein [Neorhizobium galegae]MCQ1778596.1 BA14K family protein [Neorhizobium galegae]MCQ1795087.1 BA14K family protein [Neorhizobium galegae]